jgi:hypothetical protein
MYDVGDDLKEYEVAL